MSLTRCLAKLRYALIVPIALASLASAPAFAQPPMYVPQPPPPMRDEPMPINRPGYAWDRGHWRWEGRGYAWVPGHWQPMHRNARWEPGHWQPHGPNWVWIEGHWIR